MISITGEIVFEKEAISGNQTTIDLSNQNSGLYIFEIQNQAQIIQGKIAKE